MAWTKLDDRFHTHPTIMSLSDAAFRLYVCGLNWSVAHLTDGHVTGSAVLVSLPHATARQRSTAVAELIDSGRWEPCTEHQNDAKTRGKPATCWRVHDFDDYQPTRDTVERDRSRNRERQRRWRQRNAVTNGATDDVTNAAQTGPDPTRPSVTDKSVTDSAEAAPQLEPFQLAPVIVQAMRWNPDDVTPKQAAAVIAAARELAKVGATPSAVLERADTYRQLDGLGRLTPHSLSKWWPELDRARTDCPHQWHAARVDGDLLDRCHLCKATRPRPLED